VSVAGILAIKGSKVEFYSSRAAGFWISFVYGLCISIHL
jgi:hypothetical protein